MSDATQLFSFFFLSENLTDSLLFVLKTRLFNAMAEILLYFYATSSSSDGMEISIKSVKPGGKIFTW